MNERYTHDELMLVGNRVAIHRKLFVLIMKLKVFGNPGYLVPSNVFVKKYKDELAKGERLWQ